MYAEQLDPTPERWLSCERFPDYEVSDLGRVRRATPGQRTHVGLVLRARPRKNGLAVSLRKDGRQTQAFVHVLVGRAFLGLGPDQTVLFFNGDKLDPRLANLRPVPTRDRLRAGGLRGGPRGGPRGGRATALRHGSAHFAAIGGSTAAAKASSARPRVAATAAPKQPGALAAMSVLHAPDPERSRRGALARWRPKEAPTTKQQAVNDEPDPARPFRSGLAAWLAQKESQRRYG